MNSPAKDVYYINHDWMKALLEKPVCEEQEGADGVKDNTRRVRKLLNELRQPDAESRQGNISEEKVKQRKYTPQAIPEVVTAE